MPDTDGEAAKALPGREDTVRVVIVKRPDGNYSIRPERWLKRVFHEGVIAARWVPLNQVSGIFKTIELAEREARFDYADLLPKEKNSASVIQILRRWIASLRSQ